MPRYSSSMLMLTASSMVRHISPLCTAAKAAPFPKLPKQQMVPPPHPSTMDVDLFLKACEVKHTKSGGPGGQHRNKVQTAVVIKHLPTGETGSATESRSQQTNYKAAITRLRLRLAIACRTELLTADATGVVPSDLWRSRLKAGKLAIAEKHEDFPAVLSEALDAIWRYQEVKPAAEELGLSLSQMVKLLAKERAALVLVNNLRAAKGQLPLRS